MDQGPDPYNYSLRILFSFPLSHCRRDLHSFPTRRSSDLSGSFTGGGFVKCQSERGFQNFKKRDRKSTRLNSSHVAISYAVFCLKKKKTNTLNPFFRFPRTSERLVQRRELRTALRARLL